MSTGTETETLNAIDSPSKPWWNEPLDMHNEWLNQDKELYTLIFVKTGLAILINAGNVIIGEDNLQDASGRSLGSTVQGLAEMGLVSLNRVFLGGKSTPKSAVKVTSTVLYSMTLGLVGHGLDITYSLQLMHIPTDRLPVIRPLDLYVINPLLRNMPFVPVQPVLDNAPPLFSLANATNILNVLTNVGGSVGLMLGIIATNIYENVT